MGLLTRVSRWLTRATNPLLASDAGWSIVRGLEPSDVARSGREVRKLGWERNAVVGACVRAIADIVASVDFEVCRRTSDGTLKVIPNHDAATLLNTEPRTGTSGYSHRSQTAVQFLLYGNALWAIERRGQAGAPQGLRIVHPERLQFVAVNTDGQIERYQWRDLQGTLHETAAADMLHFKDLTAAEDGLFGFPRAAAALGDIQTDDEATKYVRQVVTNNGLPGAVAVTKGYTNVDELRAAEARFNERMVGQGERGRTIFANGEEFQFIPIGFNLQQLEFPDLRNRTREDICSAFAVDPRMVGVHTGQSEGGLSGAQFREARFRLIQQAVLPVMKGIESELARWLMPEYGQNLVIRFRPDTLSELTEDETQTSTRVIAEVKAKLRTVEEARETLGLDAAMDPEQHFAGENTTTLEAVGLALEQAGLPPAPATTPAAPTPLPTLGQEHMALPTNGSGTEAGTMPPPGPQRFLPLHRAIMGTEAERTAHWRAFTDQADHEEPAYRRILLAIFAAEAARVAAMLALISRLDQAAVDALLARLAAAYAANGPVQQTWVEQMTPAIRASLEAGARRAIAAGAPGAATLPAAQLQAAARARGLELAQQVAQTTYNQVKSLILTAHAQGLPVRDTADLIRRTVFGPAVDARAANIARSEIAGSLNHGAFLAATDGRQMRSKMWVSQRDDRVRPTHVHAEGQGWLPLGKAFDNGLQYPGDANGGPEEVINCVLDPWAWVLTRQRPKPISEIKVGDEVLTHRNRYRRVVRVRSSNRYTGAVVTLRTFDREIRVTAGHPFLTRAGWNRADSLKAGDEIALLLSPAHVQRSEFRFDGELHGFDSGPVSRVHIPALVAGGKEGEKFGSTGFDVEIGQRYDRADPCRTGRALQSVDRHPVRVGIPGSAFINEPEAEPFPYPPQSAKVAVGNEESKKRTPHAAFPRMATGITAVGVGQSSDVGGIYEGEHISNITSWCAIGHAEHEEVRDQVVYNFAVEEDESYVVNGFVSHNCRCTLAFSQEEPPTTRSAPDSALILERVIDRLAGFTPATSPIVQVQPPPPPPLRRRIDFVLDHLGRPVGANVTETQDPAPVIPVDLMRDGRGRLIGAALTEPPVALRGSADTGASRGESRL